MNFRLEAPWQTYRNMLNAIFKQDPDIQVGDVDVVEDGEDFSYLVEISVRDLGKYRSLNAVLPEYRKFGNVCIKTVFTLQVQDTSAVEKMLNHYKIIFRGNPIVRDFRQVEDIVQEQHGYIRFEPEVLQFFHDDLSDFNGNWSGLAQDIAREVFKDFPGIHFCTASLEENKDR